MEMKITNENFEKEVLQADKTVLADFYADWCGPCKMLSPVLHEIAEENADTVKVVKINVDEQPQLAGRFQYSDSACLSRWKAYYQSRRLSPKIRYFRNDKRIKAIVLKRNQQFVTLPLSAGVFLFQKEQRILHKSVFLSIK